LVFPVLVAAVLLLPGAVAGAEGTAGSGTIVAAFASAAAATPGARGEAYGNVTRTRTIAVTRQQIAALAADGRRLAWHALEGTGERCEQLIQVFDRATHRLTTLRPNLNCEVPTVIGPALAGRRVLYAVGTQSNSNHAGVYTIATNDPRKRTLAEFSVDRVGGPGDVFRFPALVAGGGGTLLFYGFNSWGPTSRGVWRLTGRRAVRVPFQPQLLSAIAVDGRRLATVNWRGRCVCDSFPAWSPDGRQIAWEHDGRIWLMSADGRQQREVAVGSGARWSPDGRVIAWQRGGAIWLMRSDGSEQRELVAGFAPTWSPSGTTLAFDARDGLIHLIDRDGSGNRRLVSGDQWAWSPDGTRLAFVRDGDVWTASADGSDAKRISGGVLDPEAPQWSPDGKRLAFAGGGPRVPGEYRQNRVYVVDAAGGPTRNLTPNDVYFGSPAWSPDGTSLLFEQVQEGIWVVHPDGTGLKHLTRCWPWCYAAWSPDGKRIAYENQVSDVTVEARVINADGTGDREVLNDHGCGPVWSPDGRTILTGLGYDTCGAGIWAVGSSGGGATLLASPANPPAVEIRDAVSGKLLQRWLVPGVEGVWLSGRYAVTTASSGGACRVDRFDVATGRHLGRGRCEGWDAFSLSGRRAAYRNGRRIFVFDAKTGRSSPVALAAPDVGPVIDGKRVFWAERWRKGSRVRGVDLQ
jgi:Tol biopolymer transport system component